MAEGDLNVGDSGVLDVGTLLSKAGDIGNQLGASLTDLFKSQQAVASAGQESQQAADAEAQAKIKMNTAVQQMELKKQADIASTSAALGTNPQAEHYILPIIAQQINTEEDDIHNRYEMIQNKLDQSFLDDPIQWLGNQLTLPFDQRALENRKAQVAQDTTRLEALERSTTNAATMISAIEQVDATAKADALNDAALAQALKDKSEGQFKVAQLGMQGAQARAAINKEQYDSVIQLNQALTSTQELQIRKVALDYDKMRTEAQVQYYKDTAAYRAEQEEAARFRMDARKRLQVQLDKSASAFGFDQMTVEQFEKLPKSPLKDLLEEGMIDPYVQQTGAYGATPGQIVQRLTTANLPLNPGLKNTLKDMIDAQNAIINKHAEWPSLKPDDKMRILNQGFRDNYENQLANVPSDPEKSIYAPPPLLATISNSKYIANMELSKALAPLANADGHFKMDASQVFETANQLVAKGVLTPAAAAQQISQLYRGALDINSQTRQYTRLGLPDPNNPNSKYFGFRTNVYTGIGFGSKQLDMTNTGQLEAWLTRRAIFDKQLSIQPGP